MKRVAITGISGYLGSKLTRRLIQDPAVELILGIDLLPPPIVSPKLSFFRHDVRESFGHLFLEQWIDSAVHLAFVADPRDRLHARQVNLAGTDNLLEACHCAGVHQMTLASCGAVYDAAGEADSGPGSEADALEEDAPIQGGAASLMAEHKVEQESRCFDFAKEHPEVRLLCIRSAPLPGGRSSAMARALGTWPLLLPRKMSPLQLCHGDDLARAIHILMMAGTGGVYNVGPEDCIPARELGEVLGRPSLRMPRRLYRALNHVIWTGGLHGRALADPETIPFIMKRPCLSSRKLREEFGFEYRFNSRQGLEALNEAPACRNAYKPVLSAP